MTLAVVTVAGGGPASADPLGEGGSDGAPRVGLIGDSTLAGVRWWADYGSLGRFDLVFDAESCRRTIEASCWSREGYRPATTLDALRQRHGDWGEVLVVMSGYNDGIGSFDEAVEQVVEEARHQGIGSVVWLTLRTDVDYADPQQRAGAPTFRAANRILFEAAGRSEGDLQIADWATHSAGHVEWFGPDGVHLAPEGVRALTTYITWQVERVLAGETITPEPPAWFPLREDDVGDDVAAVQRALLEAGYTEVGGVDGVYGSQTVAAVLELQRDQGLPITGGVGEQTAAALGLLDTGDDIGDDIGADTSADTGDDIGDDTAVAAGERDRPEGLGSAVVNGSDESPRTGTAAGGATGRLGVGAAAMLGVAVLAGWLITRRRAGASRGAAAGPDRWGAPRAATDGVGPPPPVDPGTTAPARPAIYDHERETALTR